jgi:hypothetical protein
MTIGPAPMIRIAWMSVRFGMLVPDRIFAPRGGAISRAAARQSINSDENGRTGLTSCGPGLASGWPWKLNAGRSVRDALQRAVEQRAVGGAHVAGSVASSTAKPWFWLVIITVPSVEILHRMVRAVVAELHLEVARRSRGQQLVAEADAEHRGCRSPRSSRIAAIA